jgi:very-short-patch-repair endonuclease
MHILGAARVRLPDAAVFSGLTAAWLHGIDVPPCNPVEATVPDDAGVSARSGLVVRRASLEKGDVVQVRGMRVTSIARTLADVCSRQPLVEAVAIVDAALHARRIRLEQLRSWAASHAGRKGIRKLRRVLEFAEPKAESPMESRLRMVLELGGLPRPAAQVSIHDSWGRFLGRLDLCYEAEKIGVEYDGDGHRNSLAEDNRRQNKLHTAGYRLLRFTASDVLRNPDGVVSEVRIMLAA